MIELLLRTSLGCATLRTEKQNIGGWSVRLLSDPQEEKKALLHSPLQILELFIAHNV